MITTGRVLSESSTSTVTDEQPKKESRMLKVDDSTALDGSNNTCFILNSMDVFRLHCWCT